MAVPTMKPVNTRILVRLLDEHDDYEIRKGIVIPGMAMEGSLQKISQRGLVIRMSNVLLKDEERNQGISEGDIIVFNPYAGTPIDAWDDPEAQDIRHVLVDIRDVLAVF